MQRFLSISLCLALGSFFIPNTIGAQTSPSLIVKWKPQTSISLRSSFSSQVKQYKELPSTPQTAVIALEAHSFENIKQYLQNDPHVEYVEEDAPIHSHTQPNDPRYIEQWALESNDISIGAEQAWLMNTDSSSIKIALIDSGCSYNHEDLKDNVWKNRAEISENEIDDDHNGYIDDILGYDFQNADTDPADDFNHGTMVFGIIGAKGNNGIGVSGVSWNAQIMCLKVLDNEGNSTISKAIDAIDYAITQHVRIINLSWGYIPATTPSRALEEAIFRARNAGILIVASAGNGTSERGGENNDLNVNRANYPSSYTADNIIAVAATDISDQLANFSYYGAQSVDLGAPGVSILSTHPHNSYHYFTGTSAAAPQVTGAASLIWAINPTLNYSEIKRLILETTDANESLNGKTLTNGRLNLAKAMESSPAAGGNLLENPSLLPNTDENSTGNNTENETVSAQGGCSLSKNKKQTHPFYVYFIFAVMGVGFFRKSVKSKTKNN